MSAETVQSHQPASAVSARLPALAEDFGRRVTVLASLLACAMTHRALLSDDDVSVFVGPYLELCPEIGRLLAPIRVHHGIKLGDAMM